MRRKISVFDVVNTLILLIVAVSMLYPFLHLLAVALSSPGPVLEKSVNIIPKGLTFSIFRQLLTDRSMLRAMSNTIYITVVGTAISMGLTILMAYSLSRRYVMGRGIVMKLVLFTMLFSGGMIPNYYLIRSLNMIDSYWALIIPGAVSAYNMIVLMSFFRAIPDELEESGHIEGAGDVTILIKIVLPLSLPAIATISLFYAVAKWNTFMPAVLYINTMSKYPLQVVLKQIILDDLSIGSSTDDVLNSLPESKKAASIFFSVIPILCVYPFLQRHFVKGVMIGAIKG